MTLNLAGTAAPATTCGTDEHQAGVGDLSAGRAVLETEAAALVALAARLDGSFVRALDLLAAATGRVFVTGMG